MGFRTLFDSVKSAHSRTPVSPRRRPAACRLAVEALEDRSVPASLSVTDVRFLEGNAGSTNAAVTVTLSAPSAQTVTVQHYGTTDGTALAGSDYQDVSGKLTFAPGETSKSILVPVIGDSVLEPDETIFVRLKVAKNATIADGEGIVTIVNDDPPLPTLRINDGSCLEGNSGTTPITFTVNLAGTNSRTVTVNYATANGTATAGSDYQASSGVLTFGPGQTSQTVTVQVNGDRVGEPNETFFVNLSSPSNAVLADGQGVGTITDDEPLLRIGDVSVMEADAGTTLVTVTVSLSPASDAPVTVDFATQGDTAFAGQDYEAASGTVSFAPTDTSKTITLVVNSDLLAEPNETFFVNLSQAANARIADGQAVVTIRDNPPRTIRIEDVSSPEGDSGTTPLVFTVSLSAASSAAVTVTFATQDGTALAGEDYQASSGSLTFSPGETSKSITVGVIGDRTAEANETFMVILSGATNALIADGQGVGVIEDDEPLLSIDSVTGVEGNDGTTEFTFTVTLSRAWDALVTVDYATADYDAAAGSDYQAVSGSLSFAPGETSKTITVFVNGDLEEEFDEYFVVNLSNPTGANLGANQGWGTILTDDPLPLFVWIESTAGWEEDNNSTFLGFTVWLSAPSNETVTVDFYSFDGTATAWSDYIPVGGTLTFLPGEVSQTIWVEVLGDFDPEWDEQFYVALSGSSSNVVIRGDLAFGTIWDNDPTW